jgi:hypothetical protein
MKRIVITLVTCLFFAGGIHAQDKAVQDKKKIEALSKEESIPHIIVVPPWVRTLNHKQARQKILEWAALHPDWFPPAKPFPFIPGKECYLERSRANAFGAILTPTQADSLRKAENLRPAGDSKKKDRWFLFVNPIRKWQPVPLKDDPLPSLEVLQPPTKSKAKNDGKGKGPAYRLSSTSTAAQLLKAAWAADDVVTTSPVSSKLVLPNESSTPPVLYVVDTGVQPIVGTTPEWHQVFSAAGDIEPKLRFLQGRVPASLPAAWPPPPNSTAPNPWRKADPTTNPDGANSDQPLVFSPNNSNTLAQCPVQAAPYNINPSKDPSAHGTKITSTAIGTYTGLLGKMSVGGNPVAVDVESIRIYDNATNPTTDSVLVYEGIMHAIDAHKARRTALGYNPPSVLLFASRSDETNGAGFDEAVEVALWWAWHEGMLCIASAGNETTTYDTNKRAPYAEWYPVPTTVANTSPSRFDWSRAVASQGAGWPNWPETDAPSGNPYPQNPYLLIVSGHNRAFNTSTGVLTNGNGWRTGSSIGPDVDILAPSMSVPCASITKTNYPTTNDWIARTSGSSLSTGFVAGAAVAYLVANPNPSGSANSLDLSAAFRSWLLPMATPSSSTPCKQTSASAHSASTRKSPYSTNGTHAGYYDLCVPKLKIESDISW